MINRIKYSQNFLKDKDLVRYLIGKSDISSNDNVIEIGAGMGIITEALLKKTNKVIAYELDRNFFEKLKNKFQKNKFLVLKSENFLTAKLPVSAYKVFSNIPFNITSNIIKKLTSATNPPTSSYLIVQKEAAKKFAGKPIDNDNSQIAVVLNPFFEFEIIYCFNANDFSPRPTVDVVLLRIKKRKKNLIDSQNKEKFYDFVTFTYNQFKPNIKEGLSKVFGSQKYLLPQSKPTKLGFIDWYFLFDQFLKLPHNQQNIVRASYENLLNQQRKLKKIHRTRVDKRWKYYTKNHRNLHNNDQSKLKL